MPFATNPAPKDQPSIASKPESAKSYIRSVPENEAASFGDCWKNKDSCTGETVQENMDAPTGLVSDGKYLYWSTLGDGNIWRRSISGAESPSLLAKAQQGARALALDNTYLYGSIPPRVEAHIVYEGAGVVRMPKDGSGEPTLVGRAPVLVNFGSAYSIAITAQHVLWIDDGSPLRIFAAPLGGGKGRLIGTADKRYSGENGLRLGRDAVYWRNGTNVSRLAFAELEAEPPRSSQVFAGNRPIEDLQVVGPELVILHNDAIRFSPTSGGSVRLLVPLPKGTVAGEIVAVAGDDLFWVSRLSNVPTIPPESVRYFLSHASMSEITRSPIRVVAELAGIPSSAAIVGGYFYWTEERTGTLKRVAR